MTPEETPVEKLLSALRELREEPMTTPMCECPTIAIPISQGADWGYTVESDPEQKGTCVVCRLWAALDEVEKENIR